MCRKVKQLSPRCPAGKRMNSDVNSGVLLESSQKPELLAQVSFFKRV